MKRLIVTKSNSENTKNEVFVDSGAILPETTLNSKMGHFAKTVIGFHPSTNSAKAPSKKVWLVSEYAPVFSLLLVIDGNYSYGVSGAVAQMNA